MSEPESDSSASDYETEDVARRVLWHTMEIKTAKLEPQGTGLTNHVFRADTRRGSFIVRLATGPEKLPVFEHERDVVDRIGAAGVPVAEIVAVGQLGKSPFMVSRHLAGEPAVDHPRRHDIIRQLGGLAARVHTVRTVGFGFDFGWPDHPAAEHADWRDWLGDGLKAAERLDLLRANGLISESQYDYLCSTLEEIGSWDELPILNHGDLRLKNVVVDAEGTIQGLIDWEDSVSSIGPHWDISIALHDLAIDAKEAFLEGYGLSRSYVSAGAPVWRLFNALNYAPTVHSLLDAGDRAGLDQLRTRLGGSLDLYSAG